MFTLGDVADILDSALCTGISIVDALSKLSDAADNNNGLNKEKCLESLQIKSKIKENSGVLPETNLVDSELNLNNSSICPPQDYPDTYSFVSQPSVPLRSSCVKKRIRPTTFVLQDSEIKTINDAQFHRIPIIDALDDLCLVADDVFKDFDENNRISVEKKQESNHEKALQLEVLINNKVSEILESFKKLDLTVDQILTRKVVTEHLKQDNSPLLNQTSHISPKGPISGGLDGWNLNQKTSDLVLLKNKDATNDVQCNSANRKRGTYILLNDNKGIQVTEQKSIEKVFNPVNSSLNTKKKTSDLVSLRDKIVVNDKQCKSAKKKRGTYILTNDSEDVQETEKESNDKVFNPVSTSLNTKQKTSDLVSVSNRVVIDDVHCNSVNKKRDTYILINDNKDIQETEKESNYILFNPVSSSLNTKQKTSDLVSVRNKVAINDIQCNSVNKKRGTYILLNDNKDIQEIEKESNDKGFNTTSNSLNINQKTSDFVSAKNRIATNDVQCNLGNKKRATYILLNDNKDIQEIEKESIDKGSNPFSLLLNIDQNSFDSVLLRDRKTVNDIQCNSANKKRGTYILLEDIKDLYESQEDSIYKGLNSVSARFKIDQPTLDLVTLKNSGDAQFNSAKNKNQDTHTLLENKKQDTYTLPESVNDSKDPSLFLSDSRISNSFNVKTSSNLVTSSVSLNHKKLGELQCIVANSNKQSKDNNAIIGILKEPIFNPFPDFYGSPLSSESNINTELEVKQDFCSLNQDLHLLHQFDCHSNKQIKSNCDTYNLKIENELLTSNLAVDSFNLDMTSDGEVCKQNFVTKNNDNHKPTNHHSVFSNYEIDTCIYKERKSSIHLRNKDKTIELDLVAFNVEKPRKYTSSGISSTSLNSKKDFITKQSTIKEPIVDGESSEAMNRSSSDPNLLSDEHKKFHSEMIFRSSSVSEGLHHFSQPTIANLSYLNKIMSTSLTKLHSLQLLQNKILTEEELQSSPSSSSILSSQSCSSDEWVGDNEQEISERSCAYSSSGGSTFSVSSDMSGRTYSISPDQNKDHLRVYTSESNLQKPLKESAPSPFRPFLSRSFSFPTDLSCNNHVYELDMPKIESQISFDSSATFTVLHSENDEDFYKIIKKENSFIFIDSNESHNEYKDTEHESSANNHIENLKNANFQTEYSITPKKNDNKILKIREEKGRQGCGVKRTNTYLISPIDLVQNKNDVSNFAGSIDFKNQEIQSNVLPLQTGLPLPLQTGHQEVESKKNSEISEINESSKQQENKLNNRFSLSNNQKNKQPKHTQFLRRKTPLVSYPESKSKNDSEPLSSRLAALRMQLEEKRRQFDEEKKRKQTEWSKEKAKLLQNAFLDVVSNGKENQDPNKTVDDCKQPSWDVRFDNVSKKETKTSLSIVPETSVEIFNKIEKKNLLNQNLNSLPASANEMWFVGVSEENSANSQANISVTGLKATNVEIANNVEDNSVMESSNNALKLSSLTELRGDAPVPDTTTHKSDVPVNLLPSLLSKQMQTNVDENKLSTVGNSFVSENESSDITMKFRSLSLNNKSNDTLIDNYFTTNSSYSKELDKKHHLYKSLNTEITQTTNVAPTLVTPGSASNYSETNLNKIYTLSQSASSFQSDFNQSILDAHGVINDSFKNAKDSLVNNDNMFSSIILQQEHLSVDLSSAKNHAINEQLVNSQILLTPKKSSQFSESSLISSEGTPVKPDNIQNGVTEDKNDQHDHDSSPQSFGFTLEENDMTPEQMKKKERFIQNRMKKLQVEKEKKKAALEKKTQEEEKLAAQKLLQEEEDRLAKEKLKEQRLLDEATALQNKMYNKRLNELTYNTNSLVRKDQLPASVKTPPHKEDTRIQTSVSNNPAYRANNYPNAEFLLNTCASPTCDSVSTAQSAFSEYNGPMNYQKPSGKSNKKIIQNAIMHCCLCGEVNKEAKAKCLDTLTLSDASHFLVLFREGLKFRSVYAYNPEEQTITRIYGIGPKMITSKMISTYYKYNSGAKEFYSLDTKHLSIQVDGVMIKKELWDKKTSVTKAEPIQKTKPVQYKSIQR